MLKLLRANEVEVAHDARFLTVAEVAQGEGEHTPGRASALAGEDDLRQHRRCPLQIVRLDRFRRDVQGSLRPADRLYEAAAVTFRRQRIEVDRVAVEEPVVALVDRAGVELQRAVVAAGVELVPQPVGLLDLGSDFVRRPAVVGEPPGLISGVSVDIALLFETAQFHV